MPKVFRRPLLLTLVLAFVVGTFYFMNTLSSDVSLGSSSPISLLKYTLQEVLSKQGENTPSDDHDEDPTLDEIIEEPHQKQPGSGEKLGSKLNPVEIQLNEEKQKALDAINLLAGDSKKVPTQKSSSDQSSSDKSTSGQSVYDEPTLDQSTSGQNSANSPELDIQLTDVPFMPKMANETLKAQLGNAAWRLFHTILARYPDKPTKQEQSTLDQYIHVFAQVYPCGDCARHFQQLLTKYPPQTRSRKTAALWGCDIHNKVNKRLGKPDYDCTTILEDYDCGCGSDEKEQDSTLGESMEHLRGIKVDEKIDRESG